MQNEKPRIASNLRWLRVSAKLKQDELEDALGVNRGVVSNWERAANGIKPEMATKIAEYFKIDLNALYKIDLSKSAKKEVGSQKIQTTEGEIEGLITKNPLLRGGSRGSGVVPYYEADFVAGNAISFFEDNVERPAYTMQIPGYAGCVAFPSYGDSMENLIKGGSILFGRKLEDWRSYVEFGQIYGVVMKDHRRFLKYIRRAEDQKNCFLLRSENSKYDDFEVPKNKIHNIWLIEGWMLKRT